MKNVPYSSAVGSLMYAMICTRPDIAYAVGAVSRFLTNPGKEHWTAVKWILRYLRGTTKKCLCFGKENPVLVGCTDVDLAGDIDSWKSTSGYLTTFAGEQCLGNLSSKNALPCQPPRLNILQLLKLVRRLYG